MGPAPNQEARGVRVVLSASVGCLARRQAAVGTGLASSGQDRALPRCWPYQDECFRYGWRRASEPAETLGLSICVVEWFSVWLYV